MVIKSFVIFFAVIDQKYWAHVFHEWIVNTITISSDHLASVPLDRENSIYKKGLILVTGKLICLILPENVW